MREVKSGTLRRCCGRGSKTEKSMTLSTLIVRIAATVNTGRDNREQRGRGVGRARVVALEPNPARTVAAAVAVVGRRPDGHQELAEEVLVALHRELMRAGDELELVGIQELVGDVGAEDVAGASG